jgi:hypothetical protein
MAIHVPQSSLRRFAAVRRGEFMHADEVPIRANDVSAIIWHCGPTALRGPTSFLARVEPTLNCQAQIAQASFDTDFRTL